MSRSPCAGIPSSSTRRSRPKARAGATISRRSSARPSESRSCTTTSRPPARTEGIDFAFDKIKVSPNTLDAHRLIRWAAEDGRQEAVVDALFRAYFLEGRDIGDREVLAEIAAGAGMDRARVAERLASDEDRDEVSRRDRVGAADRRHRRADLHPCEPLRRCRGAGARNPGAGLCRGGEAVPRKTAPPLSRRQREAPPAVSGSAFFTRNLTGSSVARRALDDDGVPLRVARVAIARTVGDVTDDGAGRGTCRRADAPRP